MGKFERGKIREAEMILVKLLNGSKLTVEEKRHELFKHLTSLEKRIRYDYPDMKSAAHVGDKYSSPGDIKLILEDGKVAYIEVKFVSSGRGTRANISQDSLTDLKLFEDAIAWSHFRKLKEHDYWVMKMLDRFKNYPSKCLTGTTKAKLEKKARYLKEEILGVRGRNLGPITEQVSNNARETSERRLAAEIVKGIMDRDKKEKIDYINYLKTRRQNPDNIKKFVFLILAGAHLRSALKRMWRLPLDEIINMVRAGSYRVYYVNKGNLRIEVEDLTARMKELIDKDLFISFRENETNVVISFKDGSGRERAVLRIVFHWKNIFQGIKTPCLNIFDEEFLKGR